MGLPFILFLLLSFVIYFLNLILKTSTKGGKKILYYVKKIKLLIILSHHFHVEGSKCITITYNHMLRQMWASRKWNLKNRHQQLVEEVIFKSYLDIKISKTHEKNIQISLHFTSIKTQFLNITNVEVIKLIGLSIVIKITISDTVTFWIQY